MKPLAIKCYLPGRKTQYVLYPTEDMSIELGAGADLCPRGFDEAIRVQFRLVSGQWFVAPLLGKICREDGSVIDCQTAVNLPAMVIAGSATLVLDSSVDARMPARVIQLTGDSARSIPVAPGPAPALYSPPRSPARARTEGPASSPSPSPSPGVRARAANSSAAAALAPQPRAATWQPQVAGAGRAPALEPRVQPSVVVRQAEEPAVREVNETRILDMHGIIGLTPSATQLGGNPSRATSAPDAVEQTGIRRVLARFKSNPRMVAYSVLGVAMVAAQLGMRLHGRSVAAAQAAAQQQAIAAAAAASAEKVPVEAPKKKLDPTQVPPLGPDEEANATRAGQLFAQGDFPNALRQYRALNEAPGADPVFGVIAHAIEQRLRHPQVKR